MKVPGSGQIFLRQSDLPSHHLTHALLRSFRFRAWMPALHTDYLNKSRASYAVIRSEAVVYDAAHCVVRDSARDIRYGKPSHERHNG